LSLERSFSRSQQFFCKAMVDLIQGTLNQTMGKKSICF
jgi:hypothetical protein